MKDRLSTLLKELDLNATRFADEIGVQRSGISHILSGRNQPSYDLIIKILTRYPQISPDWLLLGKGSMLREGREDNPGKKKQGLPEPFQYEQPDLFNQPAVESQQNKSAQVTYVTSNDRVLLLHLDGTFELFNQAKKD